MTSKILCVILQWPDRGLPRGYTQVFFFTLWERVRRRTSSGRLKFLLILLRTLASMGDLRLAMSMTSCPSRLHVSLIGAVNCTKRLSGKFSQLLGARVRRLIRSMVRRTGGRSSVLFLRNVEASIDKAKDLRQKMWPAVLREVRMLRHFLLCGAILVSRPCR